MRVGKQLIKIPALGHLRYDQFKHNLKSNNFIYLILEALFVNDEGTILSNLVNLCHYIAEYYEDEFVSATGG